MSNILDDKLLVNVDLANGGYDYFGYLRNDGSWVITKGTTTTYANVLYKIGSADYTIAWANRTSLVYGLPLYNN